VKRDWLLILALQTTFNVHYFFFVSYTAAMMIIIVKNTRKLFFYRVRTKYMDKKLKKPKFPEYSVTQVLQQALRLHVKNNIKRLCVGQIFATNHIHRAKNNNNNRN
jgi:hypothetical protein